MGYKPAKWPTYALESLEDALSLYEDIIKEARDGMKAARDGNKLETVIALSDIVAAASKGHSALIMGKAGEYKRGQN